MKIEVTFKTNCPVENQYQVIECFNVKCEIKRMNKQFILNFDGDEKDCKNLLRLIWELCFLYEGYFYTPLEYKVDETIKNVDDLYFLNFYKSSYIWRNCNLNISDEMIISEKLLMKYNEIRNTNRKSGKLWNVLINSFYYLHSEAYEKININHLLSLLLNTCDGFMINQKGDNGNIEGNIFSLINNNLNYKKIKYGIKLLKLPANRLKELLANERNEIDHYLLKENSISSYLTNRDDKEADYVNWYLAYVLHLAIRVALLKEIGYECIEEKKSYAVDKIVDWVILGCDLDIECSISTNKMKQKFKKMGIHME